ncbi:hypothetical protein [Actinotalea sp. JY-7876]|uniref:hypothetical protein n=1 Tax=Actinotalea sp. JY-7876 TaxID=2758442 RepID=UPI0015F52506|nr:hypothetical protein [Actinotalea sp. JY-7876]
MSRRAAMVFAGVLVLVAVAAVAVIASTWSRPPPPSPVAGAASCLTSGALDPWTIFYEEIEAYGPVDASTPGSVPGGFTPVHVVVCDLEATVTDGEVAALTMNEVWFEGDVGPVLAQLRRPSRVLQPANPDCELAFPTPAFWLVDADGRAVLATEPTDECGNVAMDIWAAVEGMREMHRVEHPLAPRP